MSKFVLLVIVSAVVALLSQAVSNLQSAPQQGQFPKPHAVHQLGQHSRRGAKRILDDAVTKGTELTPLFPGYGTHFAYAYVGTPPQRQSLIVDTGSHYTAFPCVGCTKCGKHTDPYWNIKNSTTAVVPKCTVGTKETTCEIEQGYSEGPAACSRCASASAAAS
jgi:hypothetical protein